jgi:3-methyladenine DNA glycosylase AlkD
MEKRGAVSLERILERLKKVARPSAREGMARFGIEIKNALGVSIPELRKMAKELGKDHDFAALLWDTGIHEARILAGMIDSPELVTEEQMESWVVEFDSWDLCDQCCSNLFDKTPFGHQKAMEWSEREEEYVKRAAFALMACLAVHDKEARDKDFVKFFPAIKKGSADERNYVKKAVNWALRQIGKRNSNLNKAAIGLALEIRALDSTASKWVASDALAELQSESVERRLSG